MSHGNSISNFIGFIPTTSGTCNIVRKQNQFYQQFRYVFLRVNFYSIFLVCSVILCLFSFGLFLQQILQYAAIQIKYDALLGSWITRNVIFVWTVLLGM